MVSNITQKKIFLFIRYSYSEEILNFFTSDQIEDDSKSDLWQNTIQSTSLSGLFKAKLELGCKDAALGNIFSLIEKYFDERFPSKLEKTFMYLKLKKLGYVKEKKPFWSNLMIFRREH